MRHVRSDPGDRQSGSQAGNGFVSGSGAVVSEPVLPAYDGGCIASVTPNLIGKVYGTVGSLPEWMPAALADASQIVLLLLDGVGWAQLIEARGVTPTLASGAGGPITSVCPTTTATALTSIATGLVPAAHGIVGYRFLVDRNGDKDADRPAPLNGAGGSFAVAGSKADGADSGRARILNVLRWRTEDGDARRTYKPRQIQPVDAFGGREIPAVTRGEFVATGFSAAHLGGARIFGWQVPSTLVVTVRRLLAQGEPFVHAYYDGPDKVAHEHGLGEHYEAELHAVDRLVGDLIDELPPGACLVVTSDHGQVDVGRSAELPANEVMDASWLASGEGRFRWYHARKGAAADLEAAAIEFHGDKAWVRSKEQILDEAWFGGPLSASVAGRLGDIALVAHQPVAFLDPADTGETRLAARHGSLTRAEMMVPLLAFGPR